MAAGEGLAGRERGRAALVGTAAALAALGLVGLWVGTLPVGADAIADAFFDPGRAAADDAVFAVHALRLPLMACLAWALVACAPEAPRLAVDGIAARVGCVDVACDEVMADLAPPGPVPGFAVEASPLLAPEGR